MGWRRSPLAASPIVIALLAGLTLSATSARADEAADSDGSGPVIEVFTMGPGAPLLERFGHAALCVRWPGQPASDRCYNYGTADFREPASMVWGFIRGDAEFWVEVWPRQKMLDHYVRKDRSIWLQRLDDRALPAAARRQIADKLAYDARVENRYYHYHHFRDNCTTRVRDIIDDAAGGALSAPGPQPQSNATFRELGYAGFAEHDFLRGLFDLAIGRSADAQPTAWEAMFLPRELRAAITARLGVEPETVYRRRGRALPTSSSAPWGWLLLVALLIAAPAVATRLLGRRQRLGLGVSATVIGLIGLVLWLLALLSPMAELRYNEVLLLFVPSDLAMPWLSRDRLARYGQIRAAMTLAVGLLLLVGLFRQPLWLPMTMVLPTALVAATDGWRD